jgi:hypothetical protein
MSHGTLVHPRNSIYRRSGLPQSGSGMPLSEAQGIHRVEVTRHGAHVYVTRCPTAGSVWSDKSGRTLGIGCLRSSGTN